MGPRTCPGHELFSGQSFEDAFDCLVLGLGQPFRSLEQILCPGECSFFQSFFEHALEIRLKAWSTEGPLDKDRHGDPTALFDVSLTLQGANDFWLHPEIERLIDKIRFPRGKNSE